ncbi:MAG: DUF2252 domain-containing protein, partial [Chloroflexi bacterium]
PALDLWYSRVDDDAASALFQRAGRAEYRQVLAQAHRHTSQRAVPRLTELTAEGGRRIVDHPPLVAHDRLSEDHAAVLAILDGYQETLSDEHRTLLSRFSLQDVARKVVGVGSVGTRCYIVLLATAAGEPLLHRVVTGQRMMQAASDIFLGWTHGDGCDFYVRQLYDMKGSATVATMDGPTLAEYLALCGWSLARAHARSGDAAEIGGYLGAGEQFDEAVTRFAVDYAEQTARDHAALVEAAHSGRVVAQTDA